MLKLAPKPTPTGRLAQRFDAFMAAHPEAYTSFKRVAFELLRAGNRRYPASAIVPVVRFRDAIQNAGGGVRASKAFAALMARRFDAEFPEVTGFLSYPKKPEIERVIVESPFAGKSTEERDENVAYARAALRDCLHRGEAPFASHLLYTQAGVLDDDIPAERNHGIESGFAFRCTCSKTVVYKDRGISSGMEWGIRHAEELCQPIEYRSLEAA